MRSQFLVLCFFLFAGHLIDAKVVKFRACSENPDDFPCEVKEIRINPCIELNKACKVKRGTAPNIAVDFVPKFNGNLQVLAYWTKSVGDAPFPGMDSDGCKYTTCPVVEDSQSTLSYDLKLEKNLPPGLYDVKWTMTNEENKQCCSIFKVKLT